MNKLIRFLIFLPCFFIFGCATSDSLRLENRVDLQGKTIQLSKRKPTKFTRVTQGQAISAGLFGAVGAAVAHGVARKSGENRKNSFGIENPRKLIADKISDKLNMQYGLDYLGVSPNLVKSKDAKSIANFYRDVDFILDIDTVRWGTLFYPFSGGKHRVIYMANIQLVDIEKGKKISKIKCKYDPDKTEESPTMEILYANNGEMAKAHLMTATEYCANKFLASLEYKSNN